MSQFIQLHLLTSYPPSNLNRDDLGRPKTARMGGFERLRISSQSLKRHWRTSDLFAEALKEHVGTRTKRLGVALHKELIEKGVSEKKATEWARKIASVFGKNKAEGKAKTEEALEIEQLAHISPAERDTAMQLARTIAEEKRAPTDDELNLLQKDQMAADIAMFGRMLASSPSFNVEAACQVAHAVSVHSVTVEDDYFTAVDDLNDRQKDAGSAHIGEAGFAAALFYSYICINKTLLIENLGGDEQLANKAIQALTEAAMKVAPTGKQNSFASRAYASYALAEKGEQQPRSLSVAYLRPVVADDHAAAAIAALNSQTQMFDKVYGPCADDRYEINAMTGEGSFSDLQAFLAQ